jgi:hypothetical protein
MLAMFLPIGDQAVAQTKPDFGPNVYIVDPGMSTATINATLATLAGYGQFDTRRAAVLFEPGTYTGIESEVGFYESITGLGETPSAVNLSQSFLESNDLINGNDTQTFWRSMFASAGGEFIATVESFAVTADSTGTITLQFVPGAADNPQVNGIEIGTGTAP